MSDTIEIAGHMGELMQGRLGPDGPVVLVTLPMPSPVIRVSRIHQRGFGVHFPSGKPTTPRSQIAKLIRQLTGQAAKGRWIISPLAEPGSGSGTSTASLFGVARVLGMQDDARLAAEITAIEGASDPLMFVHPERLLWASRQGRIVEDLPRLPRLDIVAGTRGPAHRTDPLDQNFADISDLIAPWKAACAAGNHAEIGRLTSLSATRNIASRGGEPIRPLLETGFSFGALGVAIAHTGSARAMLFAPGKGDLSAAHDFMLKQGYGNIRRFSTGG